MRKKKRGSVTKSGSTLVSVWLPSQLLSLVDQAVETDDTDRSKFVRTALREKLTARKPVAAR